MRLHLALTFLFVALVSAKDWCWLGRCPAPSKRSVGTNDGPYFNDGPGVVHNDGNALAADQECSADCKHLHTICNTNAKGKLDGDKCHGMLCAVDKCKGCPICHVKITGPPEKEE